MLLRVILEQAMLKCCLWRRWQAAAKVLLIILIKLCPPCENFFKETLIVPLGEA